MENEIIDALDSIVWYNGHYEELYEIRKEIENCQEYIYQYHTEDNQFQVIYMILVCMYGDYGTSPRSGWLDMKNKKEILKFIDLITSTSREAEEYV